MDIKDVKDKKVGSDSEQSKRSSLKSDSTTKNVKPESTEPRLVRGAVVLQTTVAQISRREGSNLPNKPVDNGPLRSKINQVISAVNLASEATSEIARLVKSIGGIVEQVEDGKLSEPRAKILEKEANELVKEIRKQASSKTSEGLKPLAGDPIRLEVEEKLGKSLDLILPDSAKDAFGLSNITLSKKEAIIQTRVKVEEAEAGVEKLKKAVDETKSRVTKSVTEFDVAIQNKEASQVSVRDLDQALTLASRTSISISVNPEGALSSVGKLDESVLGLLKG